MGRQKWFYYCGHRCCIRIRRMRRNPLLIGDTASLSQSARVRFGQRRHSVEAQRSAVAATCLWDEQCRQCWSRLLEPAGAVLLLGIGQSAVPPICGPGPPALLLRDSPPGGFPPSQEAAGEGASPHPASPQAPQATFASACLPGLGDLSYAQANSCHWWTIRLT